MSYRYSNERPYVFTEEGQFNFLKVRDFAKDILAKAGAVRADKLLAVPRSGSSWQSMALIDHLVEIGELRELLDDRDNRAWQHRVFENGKEQA